MNRVGAAAFVIALSFVAAVPAAAEEADDDYGSLWIGPRLGAGLGVSGPRGGYMVGLELSYRTPFYFYYNLEIGFLHLLPRTISVGETTQTGIDGSEWAIAPEHDVDIRGLYGVPMVLEIGARFALGRARLRIGVGFGAIVTVQTLESFGVEDREMVMGFCFRPTLGVDIMGRNDSGRLFKIDLLYLWQDAEFEQTGGDNDTDSVMVMFGYSWRVAR